jgi:hypothetical protein
MGMGGGGQQTTTTEQKLPPNVSSAANKYLNALLQLTLPGGQPSQSPLPYQETAPLSPQQIQGMQLTSAETYGPAGASSQGGSQGGQNPYTPQNLIWPMTASDYWQNQLQKNTSTLGAFSNPALNQIAQLYAGLA